MFHVSALLDFEMAGYRSMAEVSTTVVVPAAGALATLAACGDRTSVATYTCPRGPDLTVEYSESGATLYFPDGRAELLPRPDPERPNLYAKPGLRWSTGGRDDIAPIEVGEPGAGGDLGPPALGAGREVDDGQGHGNAGDRGHPLVPKAFVVAITYLDAPERGRPVRVGEQGPIR